MTTRVRARTGPPSPVVSAAPLGRPDTPQLATTVEAVTDLGGGMRRIRLTAPGLATFRRTGPDEYVGLLMPRAGRPLVLPDPASPDLRAAVAALPSPTRPDLRWYTLRAHDPAARTVDVDVVTHGDTGPGSAWAVRVRPGDPVGLRAFGALYRGEEVVGRQVLVGDETAVPSVAAVLERLGGAVAAAQRGVEVHVEVADPASLAAYDLGAAHVHVRASARPGSVLVPALERHLACGGASVVYGYACGEAALAAGARSRLVRHGVPRAAVYHCGYWKLGRPRP